MCRLVDLPRRTYYERRARHQAGREGKGPWPAPVRDALAPAATSYALEWPAWGHRKIAALMRADGHHAPEATVKRALRARGLLQPAGYQRERRELARARKAAFVAPVTRRNRVWQTDFSELETLAGGTWQISGVVDSAAKLALACPATATKTWREAVAAIEAARGRVEELLGHTLLEDCTCPTTGQITPVVVVSDNGPCYRAAGFAAYIARRPELCHVHTRHRSPETNGVVERWFGSLKYEHLYRHDIADGLDLAAHIDAFLDVFNTVRPHEELAWQRPLKRYLQPVTATAPTRQPERVP